MGPFGSSIRTDTFVSEGVPIINGQHLRGFRIDDAPGFSFISEEHAEQLSNANVVRGDIVLTHRGNIGQVAYVPENSLYERYVASQSQFYVRCDRSRVLPEYLVLYLRSPNGQHQLLANASQVGVPSIAQPVTYLRTIEFPLPPLEEQRAIARVLGALDDRIELNRRMSETLEEMARALFRSWFVDFDPVRAKAEGRPSGLPPDLDALFPASFEASELGEIPAGWEVKSIYESADVIYGAPFSSKLFNEERQGLPLIRIRDLRSGAPQVYTDEALPGSRIVLPGRIVVGMDGEFRAHLWEGTPAYLNQRVCEFVERSPASRAFVLYGLEPLLMEEERTKTATTVIHLLKRDIDRFRLVTPPPSVHEGFRSLVEPLVDLRVSMAAQARALAEQRDALLPRLVGGALRIDGSGGQS